MQIDFTSYRIMQYEKLKGSVYNAIALDTAHIVELLKIGTGNDNEEELCNFLDTLKKEHDGLKGVLWYLIDILDEEGFFTYLTAQEIKSLIEEQLKEMNRKALMTEEERQKETQKVVEEALKKLVETQKKTTGTKSGKNSK